MLPRKGLLGRALRKPLKVVAYRGWQELWIRALHATGGWQWRANRVRSWWSRSRIEAMRDAHQPILLASDGPRALHAMVAECPDEGSRLLSMAYAARQRTFAVLGAQVPTGGPWPWHSDWRFNHTWSAQFFRHYDPYEQRANAYDIKMPWEISRMWFLQALAQGNALDPSDHWGNDIAEVVTDWEQSNPLAYSVNWHPMEASMRAVTLVLTLEALLVQGERREDVLMPLCRLACGHGEFIARTVEYSEVRGNHFAANAVALLLVGEAFRATYPRAGRWARWAARVVPKEIVLQFHPDGVNIEQSVAYHRFVTELFLLASIALERTGRPLKKAVASRLHEACRYSRRVMRPDGLSPNVGDNDDARVPAFDVASPREHGPMVGVAAAMFGDPALRLPSECCPAAVAWMMGVDGVHRWKALEATAPPILCTWRDGGVVVARENGHYLWMDVGEVGLRGRGGHGHNDLGTFELALGGAPLVVDPGCPVYSGAPEVRNRYRGTELHNAVLVDGQEIAPMKGLWEISSDAGPVDVSITHTAGVVGVRVAHHGYRRLSDPVTHRRHMLFDPSRPLLECRDRVEATGRHEVQRSLYLSPGVDASLSNRSIILRAEDERWVVSWDEASVGRTERAQVSPSYGVLEDAWRIRLITQTSGSADLWFSIEQQS